MEVVGGRAIHPVNVRLGGFYRAPARAELRRARRAAAARARRRAGHRALGGRVRLPRPRVRRTTCSRCGHPGTYPIERARVRHPVGPRRSAPAGFDEHVIEEQVPHSTALHARLADGGRYLTGPLARYSLSSRWLSPLARRGRRATPGSAPTCDNPFRSIIVRAVEMVYALEEALRLIDAYEPPGPPAVEVPPAGRRRLRRDRGAAGHPVPPVRDRRGRPDRRRPGSCRRPRRTRRPSRPTCALRRRRTSTWTTPS